MGNLSKNRGLSLIEVLVVLAILAILIVLVLFSFRPQLQLAKGRDARRKADLSLLKNKLDDYYNDRGRYPTSLDCKKDSLSPYLSSIPRDPRGDCYTYEVDTTGQWYKIYAKLDNISDPIIASLGCQNGCGPLGNNYGVSSSNVSLGGSAGTSPTPTTTPVAGHCPGETAPSCGNPQAYCPPSGSWSGCCEGSLYCSGSDYWCCP